MHWLDRYAGECHQWRRANAPQAKWSALFYRRVGVVETLFDSDGIDFEGRADISNMLTMDARCSLSSEALRERLLLALTCLRLDFVLMIACALSGHELTEQLGSSYKPTNPDIEPHARYYVVYVPATREQAVEDAKQHTTFVADFYPKLDAHEFWDHCRNTARTFDSRQTLARMMILPNESSDISTKNITLRTMTITSHAITDGMSNFETSKRLVELLNTPASELRKEIDRLITLKTIESRLPPPQEDLYPRVKGSRARQRWFWAIARVLRHVRRAPPASIPNATHRDKWRDHAVPFPRKFDKVLDYSRVPPLNTLTTSVTLNKSATANMTRLCREIGASIGAGTFVVPAMAMMELHERRCNGCADAAPDGTPQHKPFVGSFPLNARAFLKGFSPPGRTLHLAFSDGMTLPFLSSTLPREGRFKVLTRIANRYLKRYQAGPRGARDTSRSAVLTRTLLIPSLYLMTRERALSRAQEHGRIIAEHDLSPAQGAYPPAEAGSMATCGISSVGVNKGATSGAFVLTDAECERRGGLVCDYLYASIGVRAREGEFLVGVMSDKEQTGFAAAHDANAVDPEWLKQWNEIMHDIMKPDQTVENSKQSSLKQKL